MAIRESGISEVAAKVAQHGAEIEGLTKGQRNIVSTVEKLDFAVQDGFRRLTDQIASAQRPNHLLTISIITLGIMILGGIFGAISSGYIRDLTRMEGMGLRFLDQLQVLDKQTSGVEGSASEIAKTTDYLEVRYAEANKLIGAHEADIATLKAQALKFDIDFQREMRDVNATTDAKLHATTTRLEEEIRTGREERTRIFDQFQTVMQKLQDEQVVSQRQRTEALVRLAALERQIFGNGNLTKGQTNGEK